jgi:RHS repeat-associated protein
MYASGAATSSPQRVFVYGSYIDEPLMMKGGSTKSYYSRNQQFSITALTNSSGSVVERYAYDAHGNTIIMSPTGAMRSNSVLGNPFAFTGRFLHTDLELMYFRARYYDPNTGEFISRDPLEYVDGMSLYRGYFVPEGTDPKGLKTCSCTCPVLTSFFGIYYHDNNVHRHFEAAGKPEHSCNRICQDAGGVNCTGKPTTTVTPDVDAPTRFDDYWNTTCIGSNCYGYACNDFGPPTDPGTLSENPIKQPTDVSCKGITDRAISDGFVKPWGQECPPNYRLVYLVVDPGKDYHWYRRDPSGFWSHKTTGCRVSEVDGCGNKIHDPSKANHDYRFLYLFGGHNYKNCGYLCAPN